MPLVCQSPRIVYVHVPKTGGTRTDAILRAVGARKEGAGHDSIRVVPYAIRRTSTCVATLRDPWSWYASWYEHAMTLGDEGRRKLREWGRGSTEWRDVMYGVTHPEDQPRHHKCPGVLWTQNGSISRVTAPHGVYTWAVRYFLQERDGSWATDKVVDTAQLGAGWSAILGAEIDDTKANERKGGILPANYADAYDDEMIGWVARADAPMIEHFGWEPFAPLSSPVFDLRGDA
jgi:hypothetical protein